MAAPPLPPPRLLEDANGYSTGTYGSLIYAQTHSSPPFKLFTVHSQAEAGRAFSDEGMLENHPHVGKPPACCKTTRMLPCESAAVALAS